jgi:thiamine-phosphate pyrophosphorylase
LRINKKKFIYLISPTKITELFYGELENILKLKKISFFQLRLKNEKFTKKLSIAKKIKRLCRKYKVKFIVNDDVLLAKKSNADGCHLGQKDMKLSEARKILKKKIIGITCHNSIKLAKLAVEHNADYVAFGAFYFSKTKKVKFKANINLLNRAKRMINTPIVAIGGINSKNYRKLLLNNANFLAISGYVWKNKKLKPIEALKKIK